MAEIQKDVATLIPPSVYNSIERHLIRAGHRAQDGFPSGAEDEDTLTGDMFRSLRRGWTTTGLTNGERWGWRVATRKFRGHGEGATESLIGADGIVQIEIFSSSTVLLRKGILFQAKKNWQHRDGNLAKQARLMERVAPLGSVVFNYEPDRYTAVPSTFVIGSEGSPAGMPIKRLGVFLGGDFLSCAVGRFDTYFDWDGAGLVFGGSLPEFAPLYPRFIAAIQVEPQI